VHRGRTAPPLPIVEPAAPPRPLITVAGEVAWLFDAERGRLTGCELIGSLVAGKNTIRCASRRVLRPSIRVD